jgi:hypothetical protein
LKKNRRKGTYFDLNLDKIIKIKERRMDLKHLTKLKSQFKNLFKEENQNCELD